MQIIKITVIVSKIPVKTIAANAGFSYSDGLLANFHKDKNATISPNGDSTILTKSLVNSDFIPFESTGKRKSGCSIPDAVIRIKIRIMDMKKTGIEFPMILQELSLRKTANKTQAA